MDIFAEFTTRVTSALKSQFPDAEGLAALLPRVVVEPPRDPAHGDLSTNAAMVVAKPLGKNPREVAAALAEHFQADGDVTSAEVAGPGFLNFRLNASIWQDALKAIGAQGADYGRSNIGGGEKVNVEFVSANPTGPMHVGHTRGAIFGDTLAGLMEFCDYKVTREYYVNDAGGQIDVLARSAYLRYCEVLGDDIGAIPEGLYPGDYLVPVGQALADKFGDSLKSMPERLDIVTG